MDYVLPNRKAFADAITRTFLKYRSATGAKKGELFPYQKLIRDYMMIETPYRGILLYHGLGSGKTCSSIAVAESLLTTKKVFVMLPASLEENYRGEIRKCGDELYRYDQHWIPRALDDTTQAEAKKLGISDQFLSRNRKFFVTVPGRESNFQSLDSVSKDLIAKQIEDIIDARFTFIRYNGLSNANIGKYVPEDGTNPYNDSVVIVDEVHNFISRIVNKSDIAYKLYNVLYHAKGCKIVALSGTPIINRPQEISFLMNLLRGPIERISVPFIPAGGWDEEKMTKALRSFPDVDTIEFNAVKKYILVTRNPPNFRSVFNEAGDRIAVQYMKDLPYIPVAQDWVRSIKSKFEIEAGGGELAADRATVEELEALPTKFEDFVVTFLDGLKIKNPLMFQRRIQGLVSYYKGADESVLPRRVDDDKMLEKVEMSNEQFLYYLEIRHTEMKMDSKKSLNDDLGTYRVPSRLACNFLIPPELRGLDTSDTVSEDATNEKANILAKIRTDPNRYLSKRALAVYSPKCLKMLQNVQESMGEPGKWRSQFVYSQYLSLEGLGVFSAVLDANGWQPYRILKKDNQWVEDPSMDSEKPAYAFFTGGSADQREYMRQIFNGSYADNFPASLKTSVESRGKKILCMLMASSSGAEGITLENVRHVHIMEPHWTPARHDQVIGRAIRINSHARLPPEERTVRVSFYLSVFKPEQASSTEYPNIVAVRKNDTELKRYEGGEPTEVFMSTDEYLYEKAYEKDRISKSVGVLLKQGAVDCEIHRKLHSRETPVLSCMRFDTSVVPEDMAFKPNWKSEDRDESYLRNLTKRRRHLQKVQIKNVVFYIDPESQEVFDGPAFDDNQRLLRVGKMTSPTQIKWITTA
jgi:hypothetical protein